MPQRKTRVQRLSNNFLLKEFMEEVGVAYYFGKGDNAREMLEQDHEVAEMFDEILTRMTSSKNTSTTETS